jgi:ATP-dependent exoDNAse (exonuclease V) beta subunit
LLILLLEWRTKISELDSQQKQLLGIKEASVVIAGAGAGKTTSLVSALVNDLIDPGTKRLRDDIDFTKIAVITFTRAAADNLINKLLDKLDNNYSDIDSQKLVSQLNIGTIDSIFFSKLSAAAIDSDYLEFHKNKGSLFSSLIPSIASQITLKQLQEQSLKDLKSLTDDNWDLFSLFSEFNSSIVDLFNSIYEKELEANSLQVLQADNLQQALEISKNSFNLQFKELMLVKEPLTNEQADTVDTSEATAFEHLEQAYYAKYQDQLLVNKSDNDKSIDLAKLSKIIINDLVDQLSEKKQATYQVKIKNSCGQQELPEKHLAKIDPTSLNLLYAFNKYLAVSKTDNYCQEFYQKYLLWREIYRNKLAKQQVCGYSELTSRFAEIAFIYQNNKLFNKLYLDEAQDTSPLQLAILNKVTKKEGIILIGDANQSIYAFRGADLDNYQQASSTLKEIYLNNNYRSHEKILSFVDLLFQKNPNSQQPLPGISKFPKMISKKPDQGEAEIEFRGIIKKAQVNANVDHEHAHLTALKIIDQINDPQIKVDYKDYAVLLASNKQIDIFERVLEEYQIPVIAFADKKLLDHQEARDIISYLKFIVNPNQQKELVRILSSPFANFSLSEINEILASINAIKEDKKINNCQALQQIKIRDNLKKRLTVLSDSFQQSIANLDNSSIQQIIEQALRNNHYLDRLAILPSYENKLVRINKTLDYLQTIENSTGKNRFQLIQMLKHDMLEKSQDNYSMNNIDAVKIMTIHNAKGDEFPRVFVGHLNPQKGKQKKVIVSDFESDKQYLINGENIAGLNSSKRSLFMQKIKQKIQENNLKETNRLLYVAMTRAQQQLTILHSFFDEPDFNNPVNLSSLSKPQNKDYQFLFDVDIDNGCSVSKQFKINQEQLEINYFYCNPEKLTNLSESLKQGVKLSLTNKETKESSKNQLSKPIINKTTISHSQLYAWRQCSLRKKLEYDLKLKPFSNQSLQQSSIFSPIDSQSASQVDSDNSGSALQFGLAFHSYLKQLSEQVSSESKSLFLYDKIIDQLASGQGRYNNYLQKMVDDIELAELIKHPAIAEERLVYKVSDYTIVGVIDYLLELKDSQRTFIDWKTGNWKTVDQVSSEKLEEHAFQRKLYSYGVFLTDKNIQQVIAKTYYLSDEQVSANQDQYSRKQLPELKQELEQFIEQVLATEALDPQLQKPEFYCQSCPGLTRACSLSPVLPLPLLSKNSNSS